MIVLADPGKSAAVLVGVHAFAHLDGLPAVAQNLEGLRRVLTDPEVWGLAPEDCPVIVQPGSVHEVLDTVREKAREATDTLLVYYAGHGVTDEYTEELYLALPDTDRDRLYTALRYEFIRRAVLDSRARRTVVVLDCCYSGRALVGTMSAGENFAAKAEVNGSVVLTASAATRPALAPPGERYTAFTGELIDLLERGIQDGPELLDMETLYRELWTRLSAKSRPLPEQRHRNTGGLIAIARNQALREAVAGPPEEPGPEQAITRIRQQAETAAREVLRIADALAGARNTPSDPAFRPFWLAVPEVRPLYGSSGSLDPVGELVPGEWYLALMSRGDDALLVRLSEHSAGILLDLGGIQSSLEETESTPYWFSVPTPRLLVPPDGSERTVGRLVPDTWYLAVEWRGDALVVQLGDGTLGLLLDTAGLRRGERPGEGVPTGQVVFEPYWFAVPVSRQLFGLEEPMEPVGRLTPGSWYLAISAQGDALVVQLPGGTIGLLYETAGIERGV